MEVVYTSAGAPALHENTPISPSEWVSLNAAVNGTAYLEERDGRIIVIGNSTEGALLRWLREYSLDYMHIRAETTTRKHSPF